LNENLVHIDYKIEGEGLPLLFLHGFLENQQMWDSILPDFLVDGYKCITIDLPCHGNSRFKGEICSMAFMAKQVDLVLKELNITDKVITIGHSMGGYVALELSQLRSTKTLLLHSNFWADSDAKKIDRNRVIELVENGKKKFIQEAIPNLFALENREKCRDTIQLIIASACGIPFQEIQAATAGMRDRKPFYDLMAEELRIIHGQKDPIISTTTLAQEQKKLINNIAVIHLQNVGHMSIWEDGQSLIKAIKSLIIS
jgi:pimeloyl-ACP methyl ester carboxylesterase